MRCCAALIALGLSVGIVAVASSQPPPKPSLVPVGWQLDFEFQAPQPITLRVPGEASSQRFWYMLYTVTNRTPADQVFVPEFVLYTATGQLLRAGQNIPTGVFAAVQKRHNNPLLLDASSITGKILQGDDNARDGVAIWPEFDQKARSFDIFVRGLSAERARVQLPTTEPAARAGQPATSSAPAANQAVLFKTLHLNYALPGEAAARDHAVPRLNLQEWVMR